MAKSISDNPKKHRGRSATGKASLVGVRMSEELQAQIRAWASKGNDPPPLATAIRRLVELGLSVAKPHTAGAHKGASKAKSLARDEIEKLSDRNATDEERQTRRRRLLKGPEEFREMRNDLPKSKAKRV